jgi:outer membrane protein insertion porin family
VRRVGAAWLAAVALCITFPLPARAQDSGAAPRGAAPAASAPVVVAVRVAGGSPADSAAAIAAFGVRPGSSPNPTELREALRRVYALEAFEDVRLEGRDAPEGLELVLHVTSRPRIARIEFTGNEEIGVDELAQRVAVRAGQRLSEDRIAASVDSLRRIYRQKGYVRAGVTAETRAAGPGAVSVVFRIEEGEEARVADFKFVGDTGFPPEALRGQMASRAKGFLRGGKLDADKLAEDVTRLTAFYRNRGYRDAHVARDSIEFSPDGKEMTLVYRIAAGPQYRFGTIDWEGNLALEPIAALSVTQARAGTMYDASQVEKTVEGAYSQYAERGFLYVNVQPRETVRDSNVVDVTFVAQEGMPSRLNRIQVQGNTRTKEKVVRRELAIHEGDLFRRSALLRTQQDIFRLGFFQDVQVDFRPADSTDVDLILKVVEKETGTASAGAGYSSDGGLSGFLNLGHNNLFGNGQAINLQLERGAKRRSFDISFTDPWFRDSRTTFGFSIFNRNRETEVVSSETSLDYEDIRRGASLRFGRPLRRPTYTRGFLTYRIEQVEQKVDDSDLYIGTSMELDSAKVLLKARVDTGQLLTSSVEASLVRDNTINPFYPTAGQKLRGSAEFAGGVLGGEVRFHKEELDARFYLPSVNRRVTSMFRGRVGFVGNYGNAVPDYERFRLGGTTYYGLRGYEDYEVVPDENVTTVYTTVVIPDTLPGPDSTTRIPNIVRYPGGRWTLMLTLEQQFLIVNPVHGLVFAEAGHTWNDWNDIRPFDLKRSLGFGVRLEVPLLGNLGLDVGYGFDRDQPGWRTHFLLGAMFF